MISGAMATTCRFVGRCCLVLLAAALLAASTAQSAVSSSSSNLTSSKSSSSSSNATSRQVTAAVTTAAPARNGQNCNKNPTICPRGSLCLPSSGHAPGGVGVCRRPTENDMCDNAAPCDNAGNSSLALVCQPVIDFSSGVAPAITFPGRTCTQVAARGQQCDPGFICNGPGLTCNPSNICVTTSLAALGKDCSKNDCAANLLCKKSSDGTRRCANRVPRGQACNPKDYDPAVNPCVQPFYCANGKCGSGLPLGASCTAQDDASTPSSSIQCASRENGPVPFCLKSESGALKCLISTGPEIRPCGDSSNTGCFLPGDQCIEGFCGAPNGGQGDVCSSNTRCKSGLKCLQSSVSGAGSRCALPVDVGSSCEPQESSSICADGSKCTRDSRLGISVCLKGPVSIGGQCVDGESFCATGLTCVANDETNSFPGFDGICMQVSKLGGICNLSKFQICDRTAISFTGDVSPLRCLNGKCVNSTIGAWVDLCGPGTGVTCAPQDAVAKLQCSTGVHPLAVNPNRQICVHVNVSAGGPCTLPNGFGPNNQCASGLECYAVYHPPLKSNPFVLYNVLKCVKLARDGETCNYNQLIGCQNSNSSCIRGVCARS